MKYWLEKHSAEFDIYKNKNGINIYNYYQQLAEWILENYPNEEYSSIILEFFHGYPICVIAETLIKVRLIAHIGTHNADILLQAKKFMPAKVILPKATPRTLLGFEASKQFVIRTEEEARKKNLQILKKQLF